MEIDLSAPEDEQNEENIDDSDDLSKLIDDKQQPGEIKRKYIKIPAPLQREYRQKAKILYMQGVPLHYISAQIGVNRQTIGIWAQKRNWAAKRRELYADDSDDIKIRVLEAKERHINTLKRIQKAGADLMKNDALKISATDIINSIELEHKLLCPNEDAPQTNNTMIINSSESFIELLRQAREEQASVVSKEQAINIVPITDHTIIEHSSIDDSSTHEHSSHNNDNEHKNNMAHEQPSKPDSVDK